MLGHFWDLASLEPETRQAAAEALVASVVEQQPKLPKTVHDAEDGESVLAACTPATAYVIRRLLRGLGSGRDGARQGFSLALTLLLESMPGLDAREVLLLLSAFLEKPSNKNNGAEVRDYMLGQMFAVGAIVRSGVKANAEAKGKLISILLTISADKHFFREAAASVMLELLEREKDAASMKAVLDSCPALSEALDAPIEHSSAEMLEVALRMWPLLPTDVRVACPLLPTGIAPPPADYLAASSPATAAARGAFFNPSHLESLLPLLRFTTGNHPVLHGVWPTLLALLAPGDEHATVEDDALAAFWTTVVESELLPSPSHAKKHLALTLFLRLLPKLRSTHVQVVLSTNLLRVINANLTNKKSYLHALAYKCEKALTALLSGDAAERQSERLALSMALRSAGGALWDRCRSAATASADGRGAARGGVKTTGAQDAANGLDELAREQLAALQRACAATATVAGSSDKEEEEDSDEEEGENDEDEGAAPLAARAAIEGLWCVAKQTGISMQTSELILRTLAALAFLDPEHESVVKGAKGITAAPTPRKQGKTSAKKAAPTGAAPDPALQTLVACRPAAEAVSSTAAARLIAAVDLLAKRAAAQQRAGGNGKKKSGNNASSTAAMQSPLPGLLAWVEHSATALRAAEQESAAGVAALRSSLADDTATASLSAAQREALTHLAGILQLYAWADAECIPAEVGADLERVATSAAAGGSGAGDSPIDKDESEEEEEDSEGHWHDVLVDVLLSLLSRSYSPLPSAALRDACEAVFRVFAGSLTATGLEDMLAVLSVSASGPGGVLGGGDDDEEESDEEEASDDEEEESEGSSSDEEEEEPSTSANGDQEDDAIEAALAGTTGANSDDIDSDSDNATDAEMFRMDKHLGVYFASLKAGAGGRTKAAMEQLEQFRLRVVVLLEIFFKKVPASPLSVMAVVPLLNGLVTAARPSGSVVVASKLAALITQRLPKCKPAGVEGAVDAETAAAALKRALYLASRSADTQVERAARAGYVYLVRALVANAPDRTKPGTPTAEATASVQLAVKDLLTSHRTRLGHAFFIDLLDRVPVLAPSLAVPLLEGTVAARSEFVRAEGVGVLKLLLKSSSASEVSNLLEKHVPLVNAFLIQACSVSSFGKPARLTEAATVATMLVSLLAGGKKAAGQVDAGGIRSSIKKSLEDPALTEKKGPNQAKAIDALEALLAALPEAARKKQRMA